ncbi:hypothetical protein F5Y17DRAFT_418387 [Xylariaceae sp. FL0594]|nr:hypothetical protein F5Y17DRAFT_418387 [Xylariaceae sp. FL0594]
MGSTILPPNIPQTVGSLLPSLRAAAVSLRPSESVLPLLTPILRQRVQLLSFNSSNDPWIRLLCYDPAKVPRLAEIAHGEQLEPHPVSGEVEIDWDYDAQMRFRRTDEETLEALVTLSGLGLAVRLVYCTGEGEGDSWKVGEVTVVDAPSPFSAFGGASTIDEAERQFRDSKQEKAAPVPAQDEDDDDDDDDYWARYDATPGTKTPAAKRSPAPSGAGPQAWNATNEDEYFARYNDVQPAMDNHDPDEEANVEISPPLGLATVAPDTNGSEIGDGDVEVEESGIQGSWMLAEPPRSSPPPRDSEGPSLVHPYPRPGSSTGSSSSVEKLEAAAARREQNDFGVKQHISRSIKSLFMLSRASGIDREEFEQLVKTELDMLSLMED